MNAEKSVHCQLDKKMKVGKVKCNVCAEEWCVMFLFLCRRRRRKEKERKRGY